MWMRILVGIALGLTAGVFVPVAGGDTVELIGRVYDVLQNIVVYALYPSVFFGIMIAVDEVFEDKKIVRLFSLGVVWSLAITAVAVVLGALAVLGLEPQRIPPILQESNLLSRPDFWTALSDTFGRNFFAGFVRDSQGLMPVAVAGLAVGCTLQFDREITEPFRMVADSANRIFYRMNSFLVSFLAIPAFAATTYLVLRVREAGDVMLFGQLLLVVGVTAGVVGFVILPLMVRVTRSSASPLQWLYGLLGPLLTAAATGDAYIALVAGTRTGKENLGLSRKAGAILYPLASGFLRPGTALVGIAGFLLVIRSYTALEIGFGSLAMLVFAAWSGSFLLARMPATGVLVMLSFLALSYGQGMEESYLILLPVVPLLQRIAAVLDALSVAFVATVVGQKVEYRREIEARAMV